jgi:hypothetical protein
MCSLPIEFANFVFPVFAEDIPHIVDATLTWLTNDWVSVGLEKVPSLPELQQEVLLIGLYRKFDTLRGSGRSIGMLRIHSCSNDGFRV